MQVGGCWERGIQDTPWPTLLSTHQPQVPGPTSAQHGLFLTPQAITHPSWNPTTMNNDVTLLKLASPAQYTTRISPVCLASSNEALTEGLTCVTTGWGRLSGVGRNSGQSSGWEDWGGDQCSGPHLTTPPGPQAM